MGRMTFQAERNAPTDWGSTCTTAITYRKMASCSIAIEGINGERGMELSFVIEEGVECNSKNKPGVPDERKVKARKEAPRRPRYSVDGAQTTRQ